MCTLLMLFTKFYLKMLFGRVCLIRDINNIINVIYVSGLLVWCVPHPLIQIQGRADENIWPSYWSHHNHDLYMRGMGMPPNHPPPPHRGRCPILAYHSKGFSFNSVSKYYKATSWAEFRKFSRGWGGRGIRFGWDGLFFGNVNLIDWIFLGGGGSPL